MKYFILSKVVQIIYLWKRRLILSFDPGVLVLAGPGGEATLSILGLPVTPGLVLLRVNHRLSHPGYVVDDCGAGVGTV